MWSKASSFAPMTPDRSPSEDTVTVSVEDTAASACRRTVPYGLEQEVPCLGHVAADDQVLQMITAG